MSTKAKESPQILKARAKLKHQISIESKKVNPKALQKMSKMIQYWITRHQGERINLKSKDIKIFDENAHPAKTKSKFIKHLLKDLNRSVPKPGKSSPLKGRVSG